MERSINILDPGLSEHAAEWDAITVEEYKQKHLWTTGRNSATAIDFLWIDWLIVSLIGGLIY